jgi:hypothetical protein
MKKKILYRIRLMDFGHFYKWQIDDALCSSITRGFDSKSQGLKILKDNIYFRKKLKGDLEEK